MEGSRTECSTKEKPTGGWGGGSVGKNTRCITMRTQHSLARKRLGGMEAGLSADHQSRSRFREGPGVKV